MSEEMEIIEAQQESIKLLKEALKIIIESNKIQDIRMDAMQMQINNISSGEVGLI